MDKRHLKHFVYAARRKQRRYMAQRLKWRLEHNLPTKIVRGPSNETGSNSL